MAVGGAGGSSSSSHFSNTIVLGESISEGFSNGAIFFLRSNFWAGRPHHAALAYLHRRNCDEGFSGEFGGGLVTLVYSPTDNRWIMTGRQQ